jgi:hypothetical protein
LRGSFDGISATCWLLCIGVTAEAGPASHAVTTATIAARRNAELRREHLMLSPPLLGTVEAPIDT